MNLPPRPANGTLTASINTLPAPSEDAAAHSARLAALIEKKIVESGGAIPFATFMELALYSPGLGYYSAGNRKFGPEGDFVTAPELSPLFSRTLANQCREVLELLGGGAILEFGAGTGKMAGDILDALERLDALPARYYILEVSAELRARQREWLLSRVPHFAERIEWLDRLPDPGFRGVVLANEVLDAMPVHRFTIRDGVVQELYVAVEGGKFTWKAGPPAERLAAAIERIRNELGGLAEGYESEVNLAASDWVASIGDILQAGAAFLIDYGFPRREFYHPERRGGTLMCHYRHRAHPDPLILVGLQDITAHVEFTAVGEAALSAGLSVRGFCNQASFLLANGLTEVAFGRGEEEADRARLEATAQIKKLTLPSEMGELFKVMALTRGISSPLRGFLLRDDRVRL